MIRDARLKSLLEKLALAGRVGIDVRLAPDEGKELLAHVAELERRAAPAKVVDERHVFCPACNQVRGCAHLVAELEQLRAAPPAQPAGELAQAMARLPEERLQELERALGPCGETWSVGRARWMFAARDLLREVRAHRKAMKITPLHPPQGEPNGD